MAIQSIHEAAEKVKIELSSTTHTEINLPSITTDASGPKHMNMMLSCAQFGFLTRDLVDCTIAIQVSTPCRVDP